MKKAATKKFAVWASDRLFEGVCLKAMQYGISEKEICSESDIIINGRPITDAELKLRSLLVNEINSTGFTETLQHLARSLFIRFCAIRFMEVNDYFPSHSRIFTDLPTDTTIENNTIFKGRFIKQNAELENILPEVFEKLPEYIELLFPDEIISPENVISHFLRYVPDSYFDIKSENGQVEIIGWLYQFYISKKHDEIIDALHFKAISSEDVPAATQIFTTDWIVKYITDNSLGRYWIERNPASPLIDKLDFFVTPKSGKITYINESISPCELTVLDPCVGSGHFLVYAFDVLMEIYHECGYTDSDAACSIIKNNLFGLDIDSRVTELSRFALMMKARRYDPDFFSRKITPNVCTVAQSNSIAPVSSEPELNKLISSLHNAQEYGSLCNVSDIDFSLIQESEDILPIIQTGKILSNKYTVVVTNPPYLNRYDTLLKEFINSGFRDYSGDLFSVFVYRSFSLCKADGYCGFMTPFVWMFLKTYEALRRYIIENKNIVSLIQPEYSAFRDATVPICAFISKNARDTSDGIYFRLSDFKGDMEEQKERVLYALRNKSCGYFHETAQDNFLKLPSAPIAYWANDKIINAFEKGTRLDSLAAPRQGLATGDNSRFLRLWHECDINRICFDASSRDAAQNSGLRWFPYNKGGEYRKWYGNNDYVVNWENDGHEIRSLRDARGRLRSRPQNLSTYFSESITWSKISSGAVSFRYKPPGHIYDVSGTSIFADTKTLRYLQGFCNSKVALEIARMLSPTINYEVGQISALPIIMDKSKEEEIIRLTEENIRLCREDWDSFENSWDFKSHPLINGSSIKGSYKTWEQECLDRFNKLKENEEALNRLFIEIYGLNGILSDKVDENSITVRKADKARDVKSLISYAVGVMFGRYSLDTDGLAYAGGTWTVENDRTLPVSKDNILLISDMGDMFCRFIEIVFGKETVDENLHFIADALGSYASPREAIQKYFTTDFYRDHCKLYRSRPIYWQLDAGKKGSFRCLIYMHRYRETLPYQILKDYVEPRLCRYHIEADNLRHKLTIAAGTERISLKKAVTLLEAGEQELRTFEKKLRLIANRMQKINSDDGIIYNYNLFSDILTRLK